MRKQASLVILGTLIGMLSGCGKGSSGKDAKVASCNMPALHSCREYRGDNLALGTETLDRLCATGNGKLTMTACPTEAVSGVCTRTEHIDLFYTGYPVAAAELQSSCTQGGGAFRATR